MRLVRTAALAAALLLAVAPRAHAQVFGQYAGAETVPMNGHLFGGYLNASQNVVGLSAQLRLSFYPNIDFGFQGGLSRINVAESKDRTVLRMATDVKFLVAKASEARHFDLALDGAIGVESGDNYQIIALGPSLVASRTYGSPTRGVTPYASVGLLFSNLDVADLHTTDTSVPLRGGAEWRVAPGVALTGEIQLRIGDDFNDDVGFSGGVHLPF